MLLKLFSGAFVSFVIAFASNVIMARLFSLSFVAEVKLLTMYGAMFSMGLSLQSHHAFLYFFNAAGTDRKRVERNFFSLVVFLALAASLLFVIAVSTVFRGELSFSVLAIYAIYVSANMLFIMSPAVFTVYSMGKRFVFLSMIFSLASIVALVAAYFLDWGVKEYCLVQSVLSVVAVLKGGWWHLLAEKLVFPFERGRLSEFIGYSLRLSVSNVAELFAHRADKIVASVMLLKDGFAKYAVLSFENPLVNILLSSTGVALVHQYSGGLHERREQFYLFWARSIRLTTALAFPISFVLIWKSGDAVALIFSRKYEEYRFVFVVYLAVTFIRYAPFQAIARAAGNVSANIYFSFAFLVSATAASTVAVLSGRVDLLPLSYFLGWLVFNAMAVVYACKWLGLSLWKLIRLDIVLGRLLQCSVVAGGLALLDLSWIAWGALFAVGYTLMLMIFDRELIVGLLRDRGAYLTPGGNS